MPLARWREVMSIISCLAVIGCGRAAGPLSSSGGGDCPNAAYVPERQMERVQRLTVMIASTDRDTPVEAAGFIASATQSDVFIVTVRHAVGSKGEVNIRFWNSTRWARGEVMPVADPQYDVAVVRAPRSGVTLNSDEFRCMLGQLADIKKGDKLSHVGFGDGRPWWRNLQPDTYREQIGVEIVFDATNLLHGQSGGPLVNEAWQVIGMTVGWANREGSSGVAIATAVEIGHAFRVGGIVDSLLTVGPSVAFVRGYSARVTVQTEISTELREYVYDVRDILVLMEIGQATIDPQGNFQQRMKAYNIVHDKLVSKRQVYVGNLARLWGEETVKEFDMIYRLIRGEHDNERDWKPGDAGIHFELYHGLLEGVEAYNARRLGTGVLDPRDYSAFTARAREALPVLETHVNGFLRNLANFQD